MNQKQIILKKNYYRNLLDINSKKYLNASKCWKNISLEHYRVMSDIVWKLANEYEMEVYSEVIFKSGGRADIFAFNGSLAVIIEILHSEKEENIENKKTYYPDIPIIKVKTRDFNIETWKL